ncbi:MAG TPA: hypothetical protein VJB11_02165 [archaeon]|nr:hypothetical protein [archaeon]
MAFEDIGYTLFVEILGMTQYPGQPFTGEITRDLIMFLLVPSIFIILVLYMTVGRVVATAHIRIRILVGVGAYLFIIAGGYYPAFAYLAGPYFLFLIFILGILFFFVEHFTKSSKAAAPAGGRYPMAMEYSDAKSKLPKNVQSLLGMPTINPQERKSLQNELRLLDMQIESLDKKLSKMGEHGKGDVSLKLSELEAERDIVKAALEGHVR